MRRRPTTDYLRRELDQAVIPVVGFVMQRDWNCPQVARILISESTRKSLTFPTDHEFARIGPNLIDAQKLSGASVRFDPI